MKGTKASVEMPLYFVDVKDRHHDVRAALQPRPCELCLCDAVDHPDVLVLGLRGVPCVRPLPLQILVDFSHRCLFSWHAPRHHLGAVPRYLHARFRRVPRALVQACRAARHRFDGAGVRHLHVELHSRSAGGRGDHGEPPAGDAAAVHLQQHWGGGALHAAACARLLNHRLAGKPSAHLGANHVQHSLQVRGRGAGLPPERAVGWGSDPALRARA
mmetsp:Transcript_14658/g.34147  ORF Transcript_14658/g.34147 Transcript_14658/m.34147 type:complete len:215 (+) Transcript_14658:235-879(+)